ncbi:MAG: hypothetical protein J6J71_04620 [Prevotella sp.]|nr:hypothetical protein [Prevotella sp.]
MAQFEANRIDFSTINGGNRYSSGDGIHPIAINAPIEAAAYLQEVADDLEKRVSYLEDNSSSIPYITDSSTSLEKTVPDNVAITAEILKIGGNSSTTKNLIDVTSAIFVDGQPNITTPIFSGEIDGVYTISYKSDFDASEAFSLLKYTRDGVAYSLPKTLLGHNTHTFPSGTITEIAFLSQSDNNLDGSITEIQLEKGSVATPFQEPYDGVKSAKTTKIESYGADGNLIGSFEVPSDIQELDGYGEGNPNSLSVYNEVDFSEGVYKKKGYLDGSGNWITDESEQSISVSSGSYLTVESGGKIVVHNDYSIACPTTIRYQKVFSND